jgi:hypothetical protein
MYYNLAMIYAVNSYSGYEHGGENKLLSPAATLEQAHALKWHGLVGAVPNTRETQLGPFSDMNKDGAQEGFAAEFTQGGVLFDPETGRANVVAFTIDVVGQDGAGEIWFSSSDVLRKSEAVWLDPNSGSLAEIEDDDEGTRQTATVAGIAMPAMGKLLVVQMIPEAPTEVQTA